MYAFVACLHRILFFDGGWGEENCVGKGLYMYVYHLIVRLGKYRVIFLVLVHTWNYLWRNSWFELELDPVGRGLHPHGRWSDFARWQSLQLEEAATRLRDICTRL